MKLKTGDNVKIIAGKDRGKTGKLIQVFHDENRVVVEGANKLVKNLRPRNKEEKGRKVEFFAPMAASNVMLVCSKCKKPTRVGKKLLENGKNVRVCKECKETID